MASGGKRKGAGRPKGSKNKERTAIEAVTEKQRRQIEAGVEIAKEEISVRARRYAAHALEALAVTALYGEGAARVQAAREIVDRGYGKVPDPVPEAIPTVFEGMALSRSALRSLTIVGASSP